MNLTKTETEFLINLLSQITINVAQPNAGETVELVHSLLGKLQTEPEAK